MTRPLPPPGITPDILLRAYSVGLFPMAEGTDDPGLFWVDPEERGIFPLEALQVSKSLAKLVRTERFGVTVDRAVDAVTRACATRGAAAGSRPAEKTWISDRIRRLYREVHRLGFAHSVECWHEERLVGGLYGVALGTAFFGESMFHVERDASKVALVHLVARLRLGGYTLLDTQFVTAHLASLGAIAIPRADYRVLLERAMARRADERVWSTESLSGPDALLHARNVTGAQDAP